MGVHNLQEVHLWAIYFYSGWEGKKEKAIQKEIYLTYKHRFTPDMKQSV